jgi:hypothetical protein
MTAAALALMLRHKRAAEISIGAGVILLGWIVVQVIIIPFSWLQPVFFAGGLTVIALGWRMRNRRISAAPAVRASAGTRTSSWVVPLSRAAHALVTGLFLSCIALVYVGAWRGEAGPLTLAAVGALFGEGALVVLCHGNCPLGPLLRRLGDDKPLFELVLPPRAAALAVPVLGGVTVLGVILLVARTVEVGG